MKESTYLLESYASTKPGDAIRLFPFGTLVKNGKRREITPEVARSFHLPHFKPPIKLGSHKDTTPAGGFITGLEVRDDGLYALTESTAKGERAIIDGDYRYHSPEVIWEGGLEDPTTGQIIEGPLIVGTALLHTPHLGGAAALYSVNTQTGGHTTMSDSVTVPVSWLDKLLNRQPEPIEEVQAEPTREELSIPDVDVDKFAALQAERDEYAAKIQQMEADAAKAARVTHFATELAESKLNEDEELHAMLAGLDDETAAAIVQRFTALSAQIDESNLTAPIGKPAAGGADPIDQLDAVVTQRMTVDSVDYNAALKMVLKDNPELGAAFGGK